VRRSPIVGVRVQLVCDIIISVLSKRGVKDNIMNNHVNKQDLKSTNKQDRVVPEFVEEWTNEREDTTLTTLLTQTDQPKKGKHPERSEDFYWIERERIEERATKLKSHTNRNTDTSHINFSIYHLLCDPFTFVNAYARVSKNKGALTKGVEQDSETIRLFGNTLAEKISKKFRNRKYKWNPVRRTMIEKPGKKKKRPIDTPTQEDRIVQEAIRGILEAIYEPEFAAFEKMTDFRATNYGFRPRRSTWQAVNTIKQKSRGITQVVEGDIVGAYNNVDHDILLSILSRRIKDKNFLTCIGELLKSGIMHRDTYIHSIIGTPQGGIVSPLLFNIYMFEFDKYVYHTFVEPAISTKKNKINNPEFKALSYKFNKCLTSLKNAYTLPEKTKLRKELKLLQKRKFKCPSQKPESLPLNSLYARYADDWVLLLTGSDQHAQLVKEQITSFLRSTLKMELDKDKTLISRIDKGFAFLGFHIKQWGIDQNKIAYVLKNKDNPEIRTTRHQKRTTSRQISVYPDSARIHTNLLRNNFCVSTDLTPIAKVAWTLLDDYEIVLKFRQTFEGLANYYRWTDGFYALNRVSYILQYSCAKTLSYRKKSTISKIFKRYGKSMTIRREIHGPDGPRYKQVSFITHSEISNKFKTEEDHLQQTV
jgi:RNA-directed DNA polymerase